MSDIFSALGSALYARLGTVQYTYHTNGTATTTGTLGLYDSLAPQGTAYPYVVFQYAAGVDTYTFADHGASHDYVVKVVSNRGHAGQAQEIYGQAHAALQDAPLTVAGGYALRVRRQAPVKYADSEQYWHVGGLYRIDVWET